MNCKIIGYDFKSLEVILQPQERFYCERGAIIYHDGGIDKNLRIVDKGITDILKRTLSGESVFMLELFNASTVSRKLMVAGKMGMLPVDLKNYPYGIICRKGYYVASTKNVDIDFSLNFSSLIVGTGLIMQKITGDGTIFLDSIGSPINLNVEIGDSIFVDEKSFICIDAKAESQMYPSFSGKGFLGGEGISMLQIKGQASVYVNSVNF